MTQRLLVQSMIYYHLQDGDSQGLSLKWQNTVPNFMKLAKLIGTQLLNRQVSSKFYIRGTKILQMHKNLEVNDFLWNHLNSTLNTNLH